MKTLEELISELEKEHRRVVDKSISVFYQDESKYWSGVSDGIKYVLDEIKANEKTTVSMNWKDHVDGIGG